MCILYKKRGLHEVVTIYTFFLCHKAFADLIALESCEANDEALRLDGNSANVDISEGTVEVCVGVYIPLCGGSFWDEDAADVVCQQLGFEGMLLPTYYHLFLDINLEVVCVYVYPCVRVYDCKE